MIKPVLIGDFLHRIKRPINLKPDSKYRLVTIKMKHNGVVLRQEKFGADIKSKMYQVKTGDFILSGIDARNGAFGIVPPELDGAIVTNDFWYFDIDEEIVDKHFFLELTSTKWFDEICRIGSDGTTQRIRLQKNKFFNQTVFLPPLNEQQIFIDRFKQVKSQDSQLKTELTHQQTLLKKLRQQILQEAIEGKLTADWRAQNPDVEPASKLLERIAAEKAQLIKEKKIKKQKPLPPISEEETPFELPDGWKCYLLDEITYMTRGSSPRPIVEYITNHIDGVNWIKIGDTKNVVKYIESTRQKITQEGAKKSQRVEAGDFILSNSMSYGKPYIMGVDGYIHDGWFLIKLLGGINIDYFYYLLLSNVVQEQFLDLANGAVVKNIRAEIVKKTLLPIPPLAEQEAIVIKVEKLLALCNQLETQITQNQTHAEQLMQAALKEAFQSEQPTKSSQPISSKPAKTQSSNNVTPLKPIKVDYYKRMLLAAEIVHQLHRQPTLGHLKLQKLIYLCQKTEQMQLPTNFLQQAAGPYDPKMARSIDKQLKNKKWFLYQREETLKYAPLENAGKHRADFEQYFAQQKEGIHTLINLFRKAKSDQMEIVATLYACWERLLQEGADISNEHLIERFYQWSEEKAKYPHERLATAIEWMIEQGIVPSSGKIAHV